MNWMRGKGYGSHWRDCICEGSQIIARVIGAGYPIGKGWSPESENTARLIAAAPAMLDALECAVDRLEQCEKMFRDEVEFMDALETAQKAISLATRCDHDWYPGPTQAGLCVGFECSLCGAEDERDIS